MSVGYTRSLARLREWRAGEADRPVHFVPTMGNLHQGHLELVQRAARDGAAVVVSIFVNPTQFGPGEDFERYPRTLDADLDALTGSGCDLVWSPSVESMYPLGAHDGFTVRVPSALSDCLCGAARPGHFDGVAGVVLRLLCQVRPDLAVFGEKDFQQLVIIRRLVRDFSMPVEIEAAPTARADDGLALSSRNRYLDAEQRRRAPGLYRVLAETAESVSSVVGTRYRVLAARALQALERRGFEPEYVEFRDAGTLGPPRGHNDRLFAAARLGPARLIDNVAVTRQNCL
jgi:pantoate--beta-alanine ligase